jgi:uracil-DNA glycosylase family 4
MKTVAEVEAKWNSCRRCTIGRFAHKHVFFDGSPTAKFMFIGEGPGVSEDALGIPFIGRSGRLLREALKLAEFSEHEFCLTNLVACRPCEGQRETNRAPNIEEVLNCEDRLRETISAVKPKILIAVGNVPMQYLSEGFSNYRIKKIKHPSYILRGGGTKSAEYLNWFRSIKELKDVRTV